MDVGILSIVSKREVPPDEILKALSSVPNGKVAKIGNEVYFLFDEEVDLEGNPRKFFIIRFREDSIDILYTLGDKDINAVRKLEVMRAVLPLIKLSSKYYDFDEGPLVDIVSSILDEIVKMAKNDVKALEVENSKLKRLLEEKSSLVRFLRKENNKLKEELYKLNEELEEMKAKLKKYEVFPEDVLKQKIIQWIKDNSGEIDVEEFSRLYGVPETRVLSALEELVKEGKLKAVG